MIICVIIFIIIFIYIIKKIKSEISYNKTLNNFKPKPQNSEYEYSEENDGRVILSIIDD
jgi:hypothetical protein